MDKCLDNEKEMEKAAALMKIRPVNQAEKAAMTEAIADAKKMGELLSSVVLTEEHPLIAAQICPLHKDMAKPSLPIEKVLQNAPKVSENQIVIPLTIQKTKAD